jgi:hypothetical protein
MNARLPTVIRNLGILVLPVFLVGCTTAYSVAVPSLAPSVVAADGSLSEATSSRWAIYRCFENVGFQIAPLPPVLTDREDVPGYDSYWLASGISATLYDKDTEWLIQVGKPWGWSPEMSSGSAANRIRWCLAGLDVEAEIRQFRYLDWS